MAALARASVFLPHATVGNGLPLWFLIAVAF
jgi:hypothetical protein